jgi:hypothetical protein
VADLLKAAIDNRTGRLAAVLRSLEGAPSLTVTAVLDAVRAAMEEENRSLLRLLSHPFFSGELSLEPSQEEEKENTNTPSPSGHDEGEEKVKETT